MAKLKRYRGQVFIHIDIGDIDDGIVLYGYQCIVILIYDDFEIDIDIDICTVVF